MNFVRILVVTIIMFFISIYKNVSKISKKPFFKKLLDRSLIDSCMFIFIFLFLYGSTVEAATNLWTIGNFEWYLIFMFIGITCVLWIYFKWEFTKFFPRIDVNNKEILAVKKIIIFTIVMLLSFIYGYAQILKIAVGKEIEPLTLVANYTIIPGIIALDRVMNQVIC